MKFLIFYFGNMKGINLPPVVSSLKKWAIPILLTALFNFVVRAPKFDFKAQGDIPGQEYNFLITNNLKSKTVDSVTIRLEFLEDFICTSEAYKINSSNNRFRLNISNLNSKQIFWDSCISKYTKNNSIRLLPKEQIEINLHFQSRLSDIPIDNIEIFYTDGHYSMKKNKSDIIFKCSIRIILIIALIGFIAQLFINRCKQQNFLRKCFKEDQVSRQIVYRDYYDI